MAQILSNNTSLIPTEEPLLGVSGQVANLLQVEIIYQQSGDPSGQRVLRIFVQVGGVDDNFAEVWTFTPDTGWVLTADVSDISTSALKDEVEAAPVVGRWFSMDATEMTAMRDYLIAN